jgi:hypothetical protein
LGDCGRVGKVANIKTLAPHHCRFESLQQLWILPCKGAIQLAYGRWVVLLRCLFMLEITHGATGLIPLIKLESHLMAYLLSTALVHHKTQQKHFYISSLCSSGRIYSSFSTHLKSKLMQNSLYILLCVNKYIYAVNDDSL